MRSIQLEIRLVPGRFRSRGRKGRLLACRATWGEDSQPKRTAIKSASHLARFGYSQGPQSVLEGVALASGKGMLLALASVAAVAWGGPAAVPGFGMFRTRDDTSVIVPLMWRAGRGSKNSVHNFLTTNGKNRACGAPLKNCSSLPIKSWADVSQIW